MSKISDEYIAAVKRVGWKLESFQNPIKKPVTLFEELKAMVDNPNRNVYDLQSKFVNDYKYDDRGWHVCFPYDYASSYLNTVRAPKIRTYSELKEGWQQTYNDKMQLLKAECEQQGRIFDEAQAKRVANEYMLGIHKTQKNAFYEECRRWINVNELQIQTEILSRKSEVLMYSKENIGWNNFHYTISDDLKVSIKTNFGYGSAAYFFLSVKYKDLDIVPYSFIVKYYKAMMADIVRCTRQYDVRRDSWEAAFDFTVDIANQAQESPEEFIRNYVMNEVREMMTGLKAILNNPDSMYNQISGMQVPELVINVRKIWNHEKERMRAYPQESIFIFKVEKITGALHFLQSLKKAAETFCDISREINGNIETLLDYNYQLYPKIQEQYTINENRINENTVLKQGKGEERNRLVEEMKPFNEKMEVYMKEKEYKTWSEKKQRQDEFYRQHPQFVAMRERKSVLDKEIVNLENRISDYKNFNHLLQSSMELIDSVRKIA